MSKRKVNAGLFLILTLSVALLGARPLQAASELLENNPDSALALTLSQFEGSFISLEEAKSEAMKYALRCRKPRPV